jgi:hypothetical protein
MNRGNVDVSNPLPGENIEFWTSTKAVRCATQTCLHDWHDPLPLICEGFGKVHRCKECRHVAKNILRCPACKPGKEEHSGL